ncbi:MAG: hypothetical protein AAFX93_14175 [Verrucomicrobiota bacterium]
MASLLRGYTFENGKQDDLNAANLHQLVESAEISNITNVDIDANANIASSKLSLDVISQDVNVQSNALVVQQGGVAMGASSLTSSAILALSSTAKGFLPPVMTTTERDAISVPVAGLVVFNSTVNRLQSFNGTTWDDAISGTITDSDVEANAGILASKLNLASIDQDVNIRTNQMVVSGSQVSIGTASPDSDAVFQVDSSSKGWLCPRLTTSQRTGIASPIEGLKCYDTDLNADFTYTTSWRQHVYAGEIANADIASGAAIANTKLDLASIAQNVGMAGTLEVAGETQVFVPTSAPADGSVNASRVMFWVDEAGHTLNFKVKYSNGTTVRSGSVALS